MGDTFGAWKVTTPDGLTHVVVCKAYAEARSIARRRYGDTSAVELVNSRRGEVVVVNDDGEEHTE